MQEIDERFIKRLYVAYGMGEIGFLPEDLTPLDFAPTLRAFVTQLEESGSGVWALLSPESVVGLVFLRPVRDRVAEPVFHWFSWASPRNKLETALKFFLEAKKNHQLFLTVPQGGELLLTHLGKYGVVRGIGKFNDFFGDKQNALMFQSVGR